ncbi:MAG: hypothetical protein AAFQ82_28505, partial [Myxococcota bacterium]
MTLYVMLAGRPPYEPGSGPEGLAKLLMSISSGAPPPPPSAFNPDIDSALEHIVLKSISADPSQRYSAADLKSVLEGWIVSAGEAVNATRMAEFMRPFGGAERGRGNTTGKLKPLKALGGRPAQAKGGWQANRQSDQRRSAPAPIPESGPVEQLRPEPTQLAPAPPKEKPIESEVLDQRTVSHVPAEIDPETHRGRALESVEFTTLDAPKTGPEEPQSGTQPPSGESAYGSLELKAVEAFRIESMAIEAPAKRKVKKRRSKPRRKPRKGASEPVNRGKALIGAVFLLALIGGVGTFVYFAMNTPSESNFSFDADVQKI